VRLVDFFRAVDAFEMKIFCVREIYEERKGGQKTNKQNKLVISCEGRLRLCDYDFFGLCVCETTNNKRVKT